MRESASEYHAPVVKVVAGERRMTEMVFGQEQPPRVRDAITCFL